ncbi:MULTISPECIES: hypothetical protein [Desulfococcus]|uniref:Uncharacterized protein n=1 Tax=Desulfococcus multivorans DSM 2059 TaxID=1121405 RepID=S7V4U8_DESML|nr:hypothetical protein [Desulfococcus multivorans]EPR41654.1 hypothetical protein dsmv_1933 [Desulfococcus multivorans DSM 2059]SJZ60948.1 hypothetical protein SAMN02745446_01108 [Desulfococcus multivorans DSM 2059]
MTATVAARRAHAGKGGGRRRIRRRMFNILCTCIWTAVLASAVPAWTGERLPAGGDPDGRAIVSKVSEHAPEPDARTGPPAGHDVPESDADRFFRDVMLPGVGLLVIIIAVALTTIFFPKRNRG